MDEKNDSKKITFIAGSMGKGGAERVISILANTYAEIGWNVDIILLLNNTCDYDLNERVNLISMCSGNKRRTMYLGKWIYQIRRYIFDENPDNIISFIARINIITLASCIGINKKILISERSNPNKDGRSIIVKYATLLLYPKADKIVFQTKAAQSCFPLKIIDKSEIIANPISIKKEISEVSEKKLVSVGRLRPEKNHEMLINSFSKVILEYPDYKLYIYGEGSLRENLIKQITELGLLNSVFLPGNVNDIHSKISDAEIFILPSNHEGLSNALLEAMMMGLPCITTNYQGASEVIQNNVNGILVDIGSEEQLTNSIIVLLKNKLQASLLGENGKKSVELMKQDQIIPIWRNAIEN